MTKSKAAVTPTPWKYGITARKATAYVFSNAGNVIDAGAVRHRDAVFIVRAVNAHDALVAACRAARYVIEPYGDRFNALDAQLAEAIELAEGR